MTFEERVEAARDEAGDVYGLDNVITEEVARVIIRAAMPDLYGEKPTAILAELEPVGWAGTTPLHRPLGG